MARDITKHGFPMPRTAFVLLLITNLLAVLPHYERVPGWMLIAFVGVLVWRIQVFRQRWPFPGRSIRLLLVVLGFAGVILHHGTVFGPDAGVGLLITAYLFKQLEMVTRRDAFLVVILSYFVLATEFLFSYTLYTTLYVFGVLVVITATQVALNHSGSKIALLQPLRVSVLLMLQSIPMMLALFFLFPRIGPLWQLNLGTRQNTVGLSDHMSPGDMSALSRSGKLAFRAEFEGPIPPMRERYWRAAVFETFDGRTWKAATQDHYRPLDHQRLSLGERQYRYQVTLEPTGQRWLMAMPAAEIQYPGAQATSLLTQVFNKDIDSVLSYDVVSYPDFRFQPEQLPTSEIDHYLQLPVAGNANSRRFARQEFARAGRSPQAFIELLLHWFGEEKFYYTLNPPLLGNDVIDEFLFDSRRGYCAHYAGALVFLLRSAGVPARVIGGYHGGEMHPLGRYMLIHQYDAHAWAEAWVAGQGWVRVDPTAAVAPDRIEEGSMNSVMDDSFLADSPLSPDRLRNLALIAQARLLADYIDYLWYKNVVSFKSDQQNQLFKQILGTVTPQRIAALLGGVVGLIMAFLIVSILLRYPRVRSMDGIDRLYLAFCNKLARRGLPRDQGEGPETYAARIASNRPDLARTVRDITTLYVMLKYMPESQWMDIHQETQQSRDTLQSLKQVLGRQVKAFKP